jgi:ferredoxin
MISENAEIAIFTCRCNREIESISFEKLEEYIRDLVGTSIIYFFDELCGNPAAIRENLRGRNFKGVVLTGCSLHRETFIDMVESAGLNPLSLEVIPARELFLKIPGEYSAHATLKLALMIRSVFEKMKRMWLVREVKPRRIKTQSKISRRSLLRALPQALTIYEPTPVILREKCIGTSACSFCINTCPRKVLSSGGDSGPNLDYEHCSICGVCVAVCPTGAIQIPNSTDEQMDTQVSSILMDYGDGLRPKTIMYIDSSDYHFLLSRYSEEGLSLPLEVFPIELPTLGLISENILLSPIVYGAAGVVIPVLRSESKLDYLHILYQKTSAAKNILKSVGLDPNRIILVEFREDDLEFLLRKLNEFRPGIKVEQLEKPIAKKFAEDRRIRLVSIVKSLLDCRKPTPEFIDYGEPCPFGEVTIDVEKCTLCELCYNKCPMKAFTIVGEPDMIHLGFIYQRCVGCNLCSSICPENAITLKRYLSISRLVDEHPKILVSQELVKCSRCGKPFATRGKLRKIEKIYEGIGVSDVDRLQSLRLCSECRKAKLVPAEYDKWFIYR